MLAISLLQVDLHPTESGRILQYLCKCLKCTKNSEPEGDWVSRGIWYSHSSKTAIAASGTLSTSLPTLPCPSTRLHNTNKIPALDIQMSEEIEDVLMEKGAEDIGGEQNFFDDNIDGNDDGAIFRDIFQTCK